MGFLLPDGELYKASSAEMNERLKYLDKSTSVVALFCLLQHVNQGTGTHSHIHEQCFHTA